MSRIEWLVLVAYSGFIWMSLYIIIRCEAVRKHGRCIMNLVSAKNIQEITEGDLSKWHSRWDVVADVSFNRQVLSFRRLDAFYPENFLREIGAKS